MNDLNIASLSKDNNNENKSENNTIKIMLEALKEKYSLKLLIEAIISETTVPIEEKEKNNSSNTNAKSELNTIISIICQKIGVTEIFKYILDIHDNKNEAQKNDNKNKQFLNLKINNEEKEKDNYINTEIASETKVEEGTADKNSNLISLNEEEGNKDEIIYIEDSDNSIANNGGKSEFKIIKNLNNKEIKKKSNNTHSEKKFNQDNISKKNKETKLYCHCSIINDIFYKYKLSSINNKGIAYFICINPQCKGCGIYNINNKTFTLQKGHSIDNNENNCCGNNNLDIKDKIIYSYMKYYGIEELQITK